MQHNLARDLDFDKVLALVAAHARTGMGRRILCHQAVHPSREETVELVALTVETDGVLTAGGNLPLAGVDDALPLLDAAVPVSAEPADLLLLLTLARRIAATRRRLLALSDDFPRLSEIANELPDTEELVSWAAPRLGRDGNVPDEASPELARLRRQMAKSRRQVVAELEGIRRARSDVVTDAPPTLRHERYCIPVRSSARSQLPGLVLDSSGSGATAYLEPFAVVELNNTLVDSLARERDEVRRILSEVSAAFAAVRDDLAAAATILARLDAAQARALFGRSSGGRIVEPGAGDELVLCGARHPLLDERLLPMRAEVFDDRRTRERGRTAVPLHFRLPEGVKTLVISGPNAGGKTVVLKTLGLMVLMAYHGIPLPVHEGTVIPWFRRVWCHIGDEQDVAADLSTFSGAMAATARLLDDESGPALVLYDELGAGTDPLEGSALGCALLEELTGRSCVTVATTHLAAIALTATSVDGMDNAAMDYDEDEKRPTYGLRLGRPGRSRALEIAHAMGIAETVLERARELLGGQHLELDRWLSRLEQLEAELLDERTEIERQSRLNRELERTLRTQVADLEAERAKVPELLGAERDRLRQRAKSQLDAALKKLEQATRDLRPLGKRRQQQIRQEALDLPVHPPEQDGEAPAELAPGTIVRLAGLGAGGEVLEVRGSRVLVAVGSKRLWVEGEDVRVDERAKPAKRAARVELETVDNVPDELLLLGMDSEEARREVEHYLDRAFATRKKHVRIVHGHGAGVLRRVVGEICRQHPAVRSFAHPPGSRGGTGATEVTLEES